MFKRAILAVAACLLLTGCLLSPGKFTSQLKLMKDGEFAYSYQGEIQILALSKLAEMGDKADDEFEADDCYDDNFDTRPCTTAEVNEQKAEWDANAEQRAAKKKRQAQQMKAFMGGVDPSSPEAAEEFAQQLSRQKGWNSVRHVGDGMFMVDFAISGRMDHDFAFPLIEGMPVGSSFVTAILRKDGKVRIDAPGFAAQGAGNPMQGMMGGLMGLAQAGKSEDDEDKLPPLALPEGTFTIVTDGEILANNTDEGPSKLVTGARALSWEISPRSEAAPTALIDISG